MYTTEISIYDKIRAGAYKIDSHPVWDGTTRSKEERLALRQDYAAKLAVLEEQFKQDALREVGLENHPRREKIYAYAWREGHSGGYSEVLCVLHDLVEIFRD